MELTIIEGKLPIIRTVRVILRNIEIPDISEEYINGLNNPDIIQFLEIRFSRQTRKTVEGRRVKELINSAGERVDHILVGLLKNDFKPVESLLGSLPQTVR